MAAQTAAQTSLLQRILAYFELAASIGMVVPEHHVQAISALIETLAQDLSQSQLFSSHQALQAAAKTAQVQATVAANTQTSPQQVVTSTF